MTTLNVQVLATFEHDRRTTDNDMVLVAEVSDSDGNPVTDLTLENFAVWQLGITGFGQFSTLRVHDLGEHHPPLAGIYHLIPQWNRFTESQTAFAVVVTRGQGDTSESGRGMASLITQGDQN